MANIFVMYDREVQGPRIGRLMLAVFVITVWRIRTSEEVQCQTLRQISFNWSLHSIWRQLSSSNHLALIIIDVNSYTVSLKLLLVNGKYEALHAWRQFVPGVQEKVLGDSKDRPIEHLSASTLAQMMGSMASSKMLASVDIGLRAIALLDFVVCCPKMVPVNARKMIKICLRLSIMTVASICDLSRRRVMRS